MREGGKITFNKNNIKPSFRTVNNKKSIGQVSRTVNEGDLIKKIDLF